MQLTNAILLLSGLSFAAAAPKHLASRDLDDTLYVTFWENGCYDDTPGTSSTFYVRT